MGIPSVSANMESLRTHEELMEVANRRLHPSITDPNYLVLHRRGTIIHQWIEKIPGTSLRVLDIGGRYQPYRPLLKDRVEQYVALDVLNTKLVNVIGKGQALPFKSDIFDLVLATGVFEYFPEPRIAAEQIHRVLRPGGSLIMSVASVYPRAVDEEHWRYLPSGLQFVLKPFSKVNIVPEVSSIGGFFRVANCSFSIFAKYQATRTVLHHTVVPALNLIGMGLERVVTTNNDQIAGNYSALAQK